MDTKKVLFISVSVVVVLSVVAGYWYWRSTQTFVPSDIQSSLDTTGNVTESATQGVIPSLGEAANPLTNKPDINPTSKTNPFQ